MAAKKKPLKRTKAPVITNRRASYDYALGDEIDAGLSLTGNEVRAARTGRVQLKGAFVSIRNDELWLNNASFSLTLNTKGESETTVDTSPRKLLAHRKQIEILKEKKQSGLTIVPLKLLTAGKYIKVVIATGKGKKNYDKRQSIKQSDQMRDAAKLR